MSVEKYITSLEDEGLPFFGIGLKEMLNILDTMNFNFSIDKSVLESTLRKIRKESFPNLYEKDLEKKLIEIAETRFNNIYEHLNEIKSLDEETYEIMYTNLEEIKNKFLAQIKRYSSLVCQVPSDSSPFDVERKSRSPYMPCGLVGGSGRTRFG